MDENFKRKRLQLIEKDKLIKIITLPFNARFFKGVRPKDLENKSTIDLINLLLSAPNAHIDNNIYPDYHHSLHSLAFDRLYEGALNSGIYKPNIWTAKPHQVDHIRRLIFGLTDPTNESRSTWDGSHMGRGKTISAILTAIAIKTRFLIVICPDAVIKKWHDSLAPLGLFQYRICTYSGIKGTKAKDDIQWAKHKPDPDRLNKSEDMDWVQIRTTGLAGINSHIYDWSFLPDVDNTTGTGGCLVAWDEVQNAKNIGGSKIAKCFNDFVKYLHSEPKKYIRSLYLSGSIMESPSDLGYIMHALGYIPDSTTSKLTAFKNTELKNNFRQWLRSSWKPEFENITNSDTKLILFLRIVSARENKFSQIPDPLIYILYRLGFIKEDNVEKFTEFRDNIFLPNFQKAMEEDWRPELEQLDPKAKLAAFLRHISKNPKYKDIPITEVLDTSFENPITFQGLQIQADDIGEFIRINREIEILLLDIANGNKKFDGGMLGQIQRTLSELEVLKLTPYTHLAKIALTTPLADGGQGSVVISVLRNSSVRHFAWRLEAFLFVEHLKTLNYSNEQLSIIKQNIIFQITREYNDYIILEESAIRRGIPLQLKKTFTRYSKDELLKMSMEDLVNEFNKWIKYLDVEKFEYVCIFVSDIGSNPTDFDLDSPDDNDWVKEGRALSRKTKEKMKELFQTNKRRVFITNIQISREGIDLHDTSAGGKHPRTGIISPGIVARYFIQMLGRFVREGQSSETVRIVGFIDNIEGIQSWEAKFMAKLSAKVKDIQLLQNGEISLDILDNIDKDGSSILKEIINDIRRGVGHNLGSDGPPQIIGTTPLALAEQMSIVGRNSSQGKISILRPEEQPNLIPVITSNAVEEYLKKNLRNKKPSVGGLLNTSGSNIQVPGVPNPIFVQPININLHLKSNNTHLFFVSKDQRNPNEINKIIVRTLSEIGLDGKYFKVFHVGNANNLDAGVIIYRPGFLIGGLSQTQMINTLEINTGLKVIKEDVKEGSLNIYGLNDPVVIEKLLVVFESPTTLLVGPVYPIISLLPQSLFSGKLLSKEEINKNVFRLKGPSAKIMLAYYTIRSIALISNVKTFQSINMLDPNKILDNIEATYKIKNIIKDDKYRLVGSKEIVRLFPVVVGVNKEYVTLLINKEILDEYIEDSNGLASLTVKKPYYDIMTKIIGVTPEDLDKKSRGVIEVKIDEAITSSDYEKSQNYINSSSIQTINKIKEINIILTDNSLKYTFDTSLHPDIIKRKGTKFWSNLLDFSYEGDLIVVESKRIEGKFIDGRNKVDRFLELVILTCIVQELCDLENIKRIETKLEVSNDLFPYIPKTDYIFENEVWIVPDLVFEYFNDFSGETKPELIPFPRSDLPFQVTAYPIENDHSRKIIKSYIITTDRKHKFIIMNQFVAKIVNGDINVLNKISEETGLKDSLELESEDNATLNVKAWKTVETSKGIKNTVPSYENLMLFFVHIKKHYMDKIIYEPLFSSSLDIKIIKNQLWTTPNILSALISSNLLNASNIKEQGGVRIGNYPLHKYSLNQSGIDQIKFIFGEVILQSEYIVRPLRKVEVRSLDLKLLESIREILENSPRLFKVTQRSLTGFAFESIENNNAYLNIMKLYFNIKFLHGITLVSEMNPQNSLIGIEALNSISSTTDFGRGNSSIHIMKTEKDGMTKMFLVGNSDAVDALLFPFPDIIKKEIMLEEIEKGVLGRRISSKAYSHIYFMLD